MRLPRGAEVEGDELVLGGGDQCADGLAGGEADLEQLLEDLGVQVVDRHGAAAGQVGVHLDRILADADVAEGDRADGMAGYFSTRAGALRLNSKGPVDVVCSFNYVGDCFFTSDGHHGTPNQRARAATWGVDLEDSASDQGNIVPSQTVIDRFEGVLPEIVAPDAD